MKLTFTILLLMATVNLALWAALISTENDLPKKNIESKAAHFESGHSYSFFAFNAKSGKLDELDYDSAGTMTVYGDTSNLFQELIKYSLRQIVVIKDGDTQFITPGDTVDISENLHSQFSSATKTYDDTQLITYKPSSPAVGLIIYDTICHCKEIWVGGRWINIDALN